MPLRRRLGRGGGRRLLVAFVTVSLVVVLAWAGASRGGPDDGNTPNLKYVSLQPRPAPEFQVSRIGGGNLGISEALHTGTPIVLNLWASWCLPCREEMPAIGRAALRYPDVEFIGVAVQDTELASRSFAAEIGVSFDLGIDDGSVIGAYSTPGLPTTWFIDRDGMVVGRRFGEISEAELADRVEKLLSG